MTLHRNSTINLVAFTDRRPQCLPPIGNLKRLGSLLGTDCSLRDYGHDTSCRTTTFRLLGGRGQRALIVVLAGLQGRSGRSLALTVGRLEGRRLILIADLERGVLRGLLTHPIGALRRTLSCYTISSCLRAHVAARTGLGLRNVPMISARPRGLKTDLASGCLG